MASVAYTLGLTEDWDLAITESGELRELRDDAAILQTVANECRCFKRGLYYFQEYGIDWYTDQLAQKPRVSVVTADLRAAALRVPEVVAVNSITIDELDKNSRTLAGKIEVKTVTGKNGISNF